RHRRYYSGSTYTRGLIAFGSVFCLIGIVIFYLFFLRPTINYFNSRSWVNVPAIIERSGLNSHSDSDGTTYSIAVEYRYEYGGRMYRSNRYDFLTISSSGRASKERALETLRPGMTVTCWVDPK